MGLLGSHPIDSYDPNQTLLRGEGDLFQILTDNLTDNVDWLRSSTISPSQGQISHMQLVSIHRSPKTLTLECCYLKY